MQTMLAAETVGLPTALRAERRIFRDTHSAHGVFEAGLMKLKLPFHFGLLIKKKEKTINARKLGCQRWR
jgi:hypothetical protein